MFSTYKFALPHNRSKKLFSGSNCYGKATPPSTPFKIFKGEVKVDLGTAQVLNCLQLKSIHMPK